MGRILGVDFGHRRFGFAVSDPTHFLATPLRVEECRTTREAVEVVRSICAEQDVERIVLGLPLNMDGTAGPIVQHVRQFKAELESRVNLPVHLWDERLTSKSAEHVLIEAGTRREKRKKVIDKLAAQIMLQSYLDANEPEGME